MAINSKGSPRLDDIARGLSKSPDGPPPARGDNNRLHSALLVLAVAGMTDEQRHPLLRDHRMDRPGGTVQFCLKSSDM